MDAVSMLRRAERLHVIFRRLFWLAAPGAMLTAAVTIFGNWEAHLGWSLGLLGFGQAWLIGVSLCAFSVYTRAERLVAQAAEVMTSPGREPAADA